jgi:hypothetical protein
MRRLLLLGLAAAAFGTAPATASAASEHLTPGGYAALNKLWKLTSDPDLRKVDGGLNAGLCTKVPARAGDRQARMVVGDCLAAMRMTGALLAALDCPDDDTRCTARGMRRAIAAGRRAATIQARLGATVTGRCHGYFALDRRQTLAIVRRTQRVVDAYASGNQDRITAALKPWAKGLVKLADPARLKRLGSLLQACNPA